MDSDKAEMNTSLQEEVMQKDMKPPAGRKAPRKEQEAAEGGAGAARVVCSPRCVASGMTDPDTGVRIPKSHSVEIAWPPVEGSWLESQVQAGLIVLAG